MIRRDFIRRDFLFRLLIKSLLRSSPNSPATKVSSHLDTKCYLTAASSGACLCNVKTRLRLFLSEELRQVPRLIFRVSLQAYWCGNSIHFETIDGHYYTEQWHEYYQRIVGRVETSWLHSPHNGIIFWNLTSICVPAILRELSGLVLHSSSDDWLSLYWHCYPCA
jgi:hypothetical protein